MIDTQFIDMDLSVIPTTQGAGLIEPSMAKCVVSLAGKLHTPE